MGLSVDLNGQRDAKGTHMSVYFQLMKGEYDDCMEWPFDKLVSVILINQENKNKSLKRAITQTRDKKSNPLSNFERPSTDCNTGYGWKKFITLEDLHAGGYIKNDTLYIQAVIG